MLETRLEGLLLTTQMLHCTAATLPLLHTVIHHLLALVEEIGQMQLSQGLQLSCEGADGWEVVVSVRDQHIARMTESRTYRIKH